MKEYPVENFPYEYQLLFILCMMPSGLFESDIEALCQMQQNYGDWRLFFSKISQDGGKQNLNKIIIEPAKEGAIQKEKEDEEESKNPMEGKKVFKFLSQSFN